MALHSLFSNLMENYSLGNSTFSPNKLVEVLAIYSIHVVEQNWVEAPQAASIHVTNNQLFLQPFPLTVLCYLHIHCCKLPLPQKQSKQ